MQTYSGYVPRRFAILIILIWLLYSFPLISSNAQTTGTTTPAPEQKNAMPAAAAAAASPQPTTIPLNKICRLPVDSGLIVTQYHSPIVIEYADHVYAITTRMIINANLICNTPPGKTGDYRVGFIQEVDTQAWRHNYIDAFLSVEMPSLPIMDSDNNLNPWYSKYPAAFDLDGGINNSSVVLVLHDAPEMYAFWKEPLPPYGKQYSEHESLRSLSRDQTFTTWLVVERMSDSSIYPIAKVTWGIDVNIPVDCSQSVGNRVDLNRIQYKSIQSRHYVNSDAVSTDIAFKIPTGAVLPPQANGALQVFWNPNSDTNGKRVRIQ